MKRFLIALALVSGCGASDQAGNESAGSGSAGGGNVQNATAAGSSGLTGLYESGSATQPSQLCIVDSAGGKAGFGLVVWGANLHSCSGSGEAMLEGATLRLTMAGDQACAIEARLEGGTVTLPENVPEGCSYYCGARARLGGVSLVKKGNKVADAMKAKDLVGEPLCEGLSAAP